jgi:hypothetical protein
VWAIQAGVLALGVAPVCLFMAAGRRASGAGALAAARDVPGALLLGIGLSLNNARAACQGWRRSPHEWERTPKTGDRAGHPAPVPRYRSASRLAGRAEVLLAAWFAAVGAVAWKVGHPGAIPFTVLLALGLGGFGIETLQATRAARRLPEA